MCWSEIEHTADYNMPLNKGKKSKKSAFGLTLESGQLNYKRVGMTFVRPTEDRDIILESFIATKIVS